MRPRIRMHPSPPAFKPLHDHLVRHPRDADARAVLHDLLLETYPQYSSNMTRMRDCFAVDSDVVAGRIVVNAVRLAWAHRHMERGSDSSVVESLLDSAFDFDLRERGNRFRPVRPGQVVTYEVKARPGGGIVV